MCVGYRGVFRLPVIGRVGKHKTVDRSYLQSVEQRAAKLRRACRVSAGSGPDVDDNKQLRIDDVV